MAINNASTNVPAAVDQLAQAIGARIGANGVDKKNVAAFDAWQLALHHLKCLQEAIDRAIEAEAP